MTILIVIVALLVLRLAYSLVRMVLALEKTSEILKTAPQQTGSFHVGAAGKPAMRVIMLGDSIAAASGIKTFEQSVGGLIAAELGRTHSVTLENRAVIGLRMAGLAATEVKEKADLIVVIIGANDVLHFTRNCAFERSFRQFLDKNKDSARLVITGPGEPSAVRAFPIWLRAYYVHREKLFGRAMMKLAADRPNVTYIDPRAQLQRVDWSKPEFLSPDRFHPSAAGHRVWFEVIRPAL